MATVLPLVQQPSLHAVPCPARVHDLAHLLGHGQVLLHAWGGRAVLLHLALDSVAETESLGGLRGAELLRRTAALRVLDAVGPDATVVASGDVLLVLAPPEAGLADRLREAVASPLRMVDRDGVPLLLRPTASVGVAEGVPGGTLDDLMDDASAASREAARAGGDRSVVSDGPRRGVHRRRLRTERLLRRALPEDRLRLHYQPLVDLETGRVRGAEALLRMQDDDGTLVQPSELVPVLEEAGLAPAVGTWVLREACAQLVRWQAEGPGLDSVAVNVSALQVCRDDFADVVLGVLAETGLPASGLVLEITESVLLEAGECARVQLLRLHAAGVRTGVDDFGTGYASLRYLLDLPVSFVKVDRSFVAGLTAGGPEAVVVAAVLGLARDLGLHCIAEGIETAEQLAALRSLGTLQGQGYLLSRPLAPEALAGIREISLLPTRVIPLP